MKTVLFGKKSSQTNKSFPSEIKSLAESLGFSIVSEKPQVVITYGGDGTLLSAESLFPSVPKLAIRDNSICIKCQNHKDETVLKKLKAGKLKLIKFDKLEASLLGKKILATNDFVIRNTQQMHAIRFKVFKNGEQIDDLIIGDGIVASTVFGSTGYFKSITRKNFTKGYGLAFNNTTLQLKPVYFNGKDTIKAVIVRGPATLTCDNSPITYKLEGGSQISFKTSSKKLLIYDSSLMCKNCKIVRDR